MRVGLMTREYPPYVYGGAGVHVEYLSRELAKSIEVEVHAWGETPENDSLHDPLLPRLPKLHLHYEQPWPRISTARTRSSRARWRRCR
jgi:starch synthase